MACHEKPLEGIFRIPYLECVAEVPSCDEIAVGDLFWKRGVEVWEGGYEYAVLIRRGDLRTFRVRLERLECLFDITELDETEWWVTHRLATVAPEAPTVLKASSRTVTRRTTHTVVGGL